jgi:hypothetical protein
MKEFFRGILMVASGFFGLFHAIRVIAEFQVILGTTISDYKPNYPWYLRVNILTYPLEIALAGLLLTVSFRIWQSQRRDIPDGLP